MPDQMPSTAGSGHPCTLGVRAGDARDTFFPGIHDVNEHPPTGGGLSSPDDQLHVRAVRGVLLAAREARRSARGEASGAQRYRRVLPGCRASKAQSLWVGHGIRPLWIGHRLRSASSRDISACAAGAKQQAGGRISCPCGAELLGCSAHVPQSRPGRDASAVRVRPIVRSERVRKASDRRVDGRRPPARAEPAA